MTPAEKNARNAVIDEIIKLVEPGDPPCDCCRQGEDGMWMHDCHCQNSGDFASATNFCSEKWRVKQIASLRS